MPRMSISKSVVHSSASISAKRKSRFRAKKPTGHVASVASLPEQWLTRPCFVCEAAIECDPKPVVDPNGFGAIIPKFNAPLICRECRKDRKKFYLARKAMLKFFDWEETHVSHGGEE